MLFEVTVEDVYDDNDNEDVKYVERFVEAPQFKMIAGTVALQSDFAQWVENFAREQSVIWGFVTVKVTVSRYFPLRIGFKADNGSAVRSVLTEWTEKVDRPVLK